LQQIPSQLNDNTMPGAFQRIFKTRIARWSSLIALGFLLVCLLFAWFVGGRLVAPANRTVELPDDFAVLDFRVESQSGSTIAGWKVSSEFGDPVVILLHPIRGNRTLMLGRARLFHENGFSIVMIDLQAHGESPGENITLGHREKHDVEAAVKYTRANFPKSKIGVVGSSLGGASALLASPLNVDAMVLESVYPTISHAVYDRVEMRLGAVKYLVAPVLLAQLPIRLGISSSDLRPIDFVGKVDCPVMVLAGDQDLHTPIEESQAMFDAAEEPKEMVVFGGAAHVDLLVYDPKLYETEVVQFLRAHLSSAQ